MNEEQWQNLYDQLMHAHQQFTECYATANNGRTEQVRKQAHRQTNTIISRVVTLIEQNRDAYELLTGDPDTHEQTRSSRYAEFKQPHFFGNDLKDFLSKIQQQAKRGE